MKILFAIPRLTYSGAPKMMAWIANQMAEKGHDVHLVTFFSEEQARTLHERVIMHSLKLVQSESRLVRNTTGMLRAILCLHKTVKQLKPDIVVSFLDSVGYAYLPICRFFTNSKVVVSERVDPYSYRGKTAHIRIALMNFVHGVVFQTQGAQCYFERYKKIYNNSVVIPNPVVLHDRILSMQNRIPSFGERDKRIVTVGRLSIYQKRQDVLLEAFKLFRMQHPEYRLVIYGDGQDKERIQALINELELTECAKLAGTYGSC